jgi:hypothetical protein
MATPYRVPVLEHFEWQPPVIAFQNTPPVAPPRGARYVVGLTPTGAWSANADNIAYCSNATGPVWKFDAPLEGMTLWDVATYRYMTYTQGAWVAMATSGYSGVSGYSGTSGYSGGSGYSGLSGYSGQDGVSGYSGISGYSGADGVSGYSGLSGYSGADGVSGYSGQSGYSGVSGYSGGSGYSGESGYSGLSGYSGVSGYSGTSGYSGASGFSGPGACYDTDYFCLIIGADPC